ncbi:MAG: translation elongation factor Ts [Deltaproteobacteria bacterium]|nr:translation elongation factor Ts [Deltaproteobacteria bacterium]
MAEINAKQVKALREKTGAGMMDCKKALQETGGDTEKAVEFLRQKGLASAKKRQARTAKEGLIHSYIHPGGKLGVLVEVNCETDFVAKNEEFQQFVKDVAMQIAATAPLCVKPEELDQEEIDKESRIYKAQALEQGKPENIVNKIVDGKLKKWRREVVLMEQAFVKDQDRTVQQLQDELRAKIGEKIEIRRFARFGLGEGQEDTGEE